MGRKAQPKPKRLASKLHGIRSVLGITQEEMVKRIKVFAPSAAILPGHISQFENSNRLPSFLVLLAYAKIGQISTDVLIDDKLDLSQDSLTVESRKRITKPLCTESA